MIVAMTDDALPQDGIEVFAAPHFSGDDRFEEVGIPLNALSEVAAFERVIRSLARLIYLRSHVRVPKEFAARLDLRLQAVDPGSAVPIILRARRTPQLFPAQDEFDGAFNLLVTALRWAETAPDLSTLPDGVTREMLGVCGQLGANLGEGETIDFFERELNVRTASCTRNIRRRLRTAADPDHRWLPVTVVGALIGTDFEPHSLRVKPLRMRKLGVLCGGPIPEEVLAAANRGHRTVVVRGDGLYTLDGVLVEVRDPTDIHSVMSRASESAARSVGAFTRNVVALRTRDAGWFEGEGLAPDAAVVRLVAAVVRESHDRFGTALPVVSSTVEGAVTLDWDRVPWRIGGEVEAGSTSLSMFAVHTDHRPPTFAVVDLVAANASGEIADFVGFLPLVDDP